MYNEKKQPHPVDPHWKCVKRFRHGQIELQLSRWRDTDRMSFRIVLAREEHHPRTLCHISTLDANLSRVEKLAARARAFCEDELGVTEPKFERQVEEDDVVVLEPDAGLGR